MIASRAELRRIAMQHPEINQVEKRCEKIVLASDKLKIYGLQQWYHACWVWPGPFHNGSPCKKIKKKRIFLRPFLYKFLHKDHDSKHSRIHMICGQPGCLNPLHMTTNKESAREYEQLLTDSLGEKNGRD